jgi:hypothetical protein
MSASEYDQIERDAQDALRASMEAIGTPSARERALADPDEIQRNVKKIIVHQRLQSQLTPYRSWIRKNERYFQIISRLGSEVTGTAIFLFAPDKDDLRIALPGIGSSTASGSVIPQEWKKVYFLRSKGSLPEEEVYTYEDLNDLVSRAWTRFRAAPMNQSVEIPIDDLPALYVGVARALSEGIPLRFGPPNQEARRKESFRQPDSEASEVVLIESIADAENLAGVLYARFCGADLVCVDAPDLERIQRSVDAINAAKGGTSDANFEELVFAPSQHSSPNKGLREWLPNLTGFLGSKSIHHLVRELEDATTGHLSDEQLKMVGSRRLTTFTIGVPYNFVSRGSVSWKNKAIGHLTGDKSLNLLTELLITERPGGIGLIVFDPGYFETDETANAIGELSRHSAHSIVLDGPAATADALMYLAQVLPLEIVFFNTHGSDNAILLGDGPPLYSHLLVQWVSFHSHPVIINNSCLSWTGVGREFLRVGSRGYIGTLWSIDALRAQTLRATRFKE